MIKWHVKRKIFKTILLDCENKPVHTITFCRGKYLITGINKISSISISRLDFNLLAVEGSFNGQVKILLGNDNFPLPARALSAEITLNEESYSLEQLPNRDFRIMNAGKIQGYFTKTLKRTVDAETLETWESDIIALLYVISNIMLHEDDIYV